jgi:type II secretory pathway pseudopilin PulG
LIELLIAMAVLTTCGAAMVGLLMAAQRMARRQPEAADQQQRARSALQTLAQELDRAGAGLGAGARAGPLAQWFTPIAASAEGGVTTWCVVGEAGGTLAGALDVSGAVALIAPDGRCPAGQPACGFVAGSPAILFDDLGCHDVARIDGVTAEALTLRPTVRGCVYQPGASIARGEVRTYFVDAAARQLLRRDEASHSTQPVIDNVGGMNVEYFDSGRRVRITLRFVSALLQMPDLVVSLDAAPPNLQGG